MGCQKEIVKSIVEKSGEYIIALKKNQSNLYKNVEEVFKEAIGKGFEGFKHGEFIATAKMVRTNSIIIR